MVKQFKCEAIKVKLSLMALFLNGNYKKLFLNFKKVKY